MVHNGVEYGDMQMICEVYSIMKGLLGLSAPEQADVFANWNKTELDSYLIEITAEILAKMDDETGKPMVDVILDTAGQKGTGKWTSTSGLDLGAPVPTVAEAVFARCLSAIKGERVAASKVLTGPSASPIEIDKAEALENLRQALYMSKICSYAQGFQLIQYAAKEYKWDLNYGDIALMWRGGCIIRAQFLDEIKKAFDADPNCVNLLLVPYFKAAVDKAQPALRWAVSEAVKHGIPTPTLSSAIAYYDSYRAEVLPANLLQAQRDYFGAHTYERTDKPRGQFFHTNWTGRGGTTSSTTYNV
jgi:6-phosphogluconate dehydrogenase